MSWRIFEESFKKNTIKNLFGDLIQNLKDISNIFQSGGGWSSFERPGQGHVQT